MNDLTKVAAAPRPARPAHAKSTRSKTLTKVARTAVKQGKAAGKKSLRAIQPVMESIRQEQPQTIAKIVIAAVTSRLLAGAIQTVVRRPLAVALALGFVAAVVVATTEAEPEGAAV